MYNHSNLIEMRQMNDKIFIDTNILLYLYDKDMAKKQIAKDIFKSKYTISTQVLNEFSNISLKKFKLSIEDVTTSLSVIIDNTKVVVFTQHSILKALEIKNRYSFGYYDSLILATAIENNCNILYSEDMHNGQIIEDKLTIINPFKDN